MLSFVNINHACVFHNVECVIFKYVKIFNAYYNTLHNYYHFTLTLPSLIILVATLSGNRQPRWLSGLRRGRVHSLMIARRSLCPEKLGSNPGQGSKGINFSGWHGLDMSITVTKRR